MESIRLRTNKKVEGTKPWEITLADGTTKVSMEVWFGCVKILKFQSLPFFWEQIHGAFLLGYHSHYGSIGRVYWPGSQITRLFWWWKTLLLRVQTSKQRTNRFQVPTWMVDSYRYGILAHRTWEWFRGTWIPCVSFRWLDTLIIWEYDDWFLVFDVVSCVFDIFFGIHVWYICLYIYHEHQPCM